jgi:hypothetical protein
LALFELVLILLLELFEALNRQDKIFLRVLKVFHSLVREGKIIIKLGKFCTLELVDVILILESRRTYNFINFIFLLSLLLLLNELSLPDLEHPLQQLTCALKFFSLSKVNTNPLDNAGILLFDAHIKAAKNLLLLLEQLF